MIELKQYQLNAIEELKEKTNELLDFSDSKVCVFQAPTGSGKTVMLAEMLKRLVTNRTDSKKLAFIWISLRSLHEQSKERLDVYFEDSRTIKCSYFEDLEEKRIGENEVLFINWESINKKDNIFIKENEQENNLSKVVENTKEEGRELVLIIDESHHTAKSEKSLDLILNTINPKVTLEVTATPARLSGHLVEIDLIKVKEEGMIKTEVSINPELDKERVKKDPDELIIKCALDKREQLLKKFKKEGSDINPLLLIQLPDRKAGVMDKKEDIEQILRDKFNISEENGKLARWLSDDKTPNLENIKKDNSDVEVLIFKHAISLGWDCPRAQILVLFREWKSIIFSIQTVGRIMRMPEFRHYNDEDLNKGYVYTNLPNFEIAEDVAKDYITLYEARRNDKIYKNIDLNSVYLKRQREKTRLSGEFSKIFLDVAKKEKIEDKITLKPAELVNQIMVDGRIVTLDKAQLIKTDKEVKVRITPKELQYRFELFIASLCSPFAPADSSGRIRTALYKAFEKFFEIGDWDEVQKLVLSQENYQTIMDLVNKAKEEYTIKVVQEISEQREEIPNIWNVPTLVSFNSRFTEKKYNKCIMLPSYMKDASKPEADFIEILDEKENKVSWWFKNGESEIKWFAIKYADENGLERAFYVDFVVAMKDGSIGLFETKAGITAKSEETKMKAEALAEYIARENKKGKKLWGGIVIFKDGSCRYNDNKKYEFNESQLGDKWNFLSFR